MRVHGAIFVAVAAIVLSACGSSGGTKPSAGGTRLGTPSTSVTETTLDCVKYSDTAQKIVAAQQKLYSGSGDTTAALETLKSELDALKDGAPADVTSAVDDLESAFDKVEELVRNPTSDAQASLASMGATLATDGQKISTYIVSQCK